MAQLDRNEPKRTQRFEKQHRRRKQALAEPEALPAPSSLNHTEGDRIYRQHYQKRSDDALDKLVVRHITKGGLVDDVLDLLDNQGAQRMWQCPVCDEFGSESEEHVRGCCVRSISKKEGYGW